VKLLEWWNCKFDVARTSYRWRTSSTTTTAQRHSIRKDSIGISKQFIAKYKSHRPGCGSQHANNAVCDGTIGPALFVCLHNLLQLTPHKDLFNTTHPRCTRRNSVSAFVARDWLYH